MKIYLTDACAGICPEKVDIGRADAALTGRVKAAVFENIGAPVPKAAPRRAKKTLRTVLLAAALTALLSVTAYAVTSFTMQREEIPEGEGLAGRNTYADADGNIITDAKAVLPDAGMSFSFTGSEEARNVPQFRCFWLPDEPTYGMTDADGWTQHLINDGDGCSNSIPYVIDIQNVPTGNSRYVISGRAEAVSEEDWGAWHVQMISSDYVCQVVGLHGNRGAWHVQMISSDYSGTSYDYENDRANYVLLFDASRGYLVTVCGTAELETLAHIARELEVRESNIPYVSVDDMVVESVSILEPGRG